MQARPGGEAFADQDLLRFAVRWIGIEIINGIVRPRHAPVLQETFATDEVDGLQIDSFIGGGVKHRNAKRVAEPEAANFVRENLFTIEVAMIVRVFDRSSLLGPYLTGF